MNKSELIESLKAGNGLNKNEAKVAVNLFFDEMSSALASGDRVEIRGLCSFFVKEYEGYTGRNPKTGKNVKVPPKKPLSGADSKNTVGTAVMARIKNVEKEFPREMVESLSVGATTA